jgi:carboxymethylenebutenolidase
MIRHINDVIEIETGSGRMPVHRWLPPSGRGPGLLVFQEIFGISSYIRSRATNLAAAGYVVLAPDFYWRLDDADLDETRPDALDRALDIAGRVDWQRAVDDGRTAADALRTMDETTDRIGLVGFCFGGGLAFNVAAGFDVDALVSYYGSALPDLLHLTDSVSAPSLHHFGLADTYIEPETVAVIQRAVEGPDVVFETYAGAGHAFDNPHPDFYHAEASGRAWLATLDFLEAHLQKAGS